MKKKTYLFLFLQRDVFPVTMNRSRSTTANILHPELEFENAELFCMKKSMNFLIVIFKL